ncbi:IS5 family transposase [Rhizobium leguminosarum]|nr:IS5 family transposase [Rhizobium leguminosarum]
MGVKRYELNEAQWSRIAPLLPGKAGDPGRTGVDNRLFVNGCLWILRSGAHWQDLPERYGKWKTVHRRFSRWCHAGVWERVFDALTADRDNQYLMIDSTIVRAQAEKGGQGSGAGAFQRWTDDQDPYAGRCARASLALYRDGRPGRRHHASSRSSS